MTCECEHPWHHGEPCPNPVADLDGVETSPALCMPCLFGCPVEDWPS